MFRKLYYSLSPNLRFLARKIYYFPIDTVETLTGKRNKYEPKKGDIFTGSGDFIKTGTQQVQLLKEYAGLQENHQVLDIGCGIGRTAAMLTEYLGKKGKYEGFDAVEKGILWCNKTIHRDFPNFNFRYTPIENDLYTKKGQDAAKFQFPYPDNYFDVAFLFSVFTHMQPDEVQNYLIEIQRVLKPSGKCLATFFIGTDTTQKRFNEMFPFEKEGYFLMDEQVKNANIAFQEKTLDLMIEKSGLKKRKFVDGYWKDFSLKHENNEFQDILLLEKS